MTKTSMSDYRAHVLFPADVADRELIAELLSDPTVETIDHSAPLRQQHDSLLPRTTGPDESEESRPWVFFPWRATITRLLGPTEFRNLRLDRNRNKITRSEQEHLGSLKIGVVGLSVGHAIAHTLALEGLCGELRLADFDSIELSNLNRIPASVLDIGINKAVVVARRIAELDPYLPVSVLTDGLTDLNLEEFFEGLDLVVEECDSLDIKLKVRLEARRRGIPVMMETSDRGLFDVERFDTEPERALFHGLLGDIDPESLKGLSTREKAPHVMRILQAVDLSPRMAASMVEIDRTLNTWPQLGGDVQLGAATVAAAVRRLGRGDPLPSGRIRVDIDEALQSLESPAPSQAVAASEPGSKLIDTNPGVAAEAVIQAIRLAPSGGNVQPWRVRQGLDEVQIELDPERTSEMDIGYRGSYVAIGAAALNARIALASHGQRGRTEFHQPTAQNHLCATVTAEECGDPELAQMYNAMQYRISNRNMGRRRELSTHVRQDLSRAAELEGGRLRLLTEPDLLAEAALILASSDRARYLTPLLHRQMMSELKWPELDSLESGIDVRTLGLDSADLAKLKVAERADVMAYLRDWGGGAALGDNTRDRVQGGSALAMVTVTGKSAGDYLRGGAAMQRVWIRAHHHGLAISPISPIFLYAQTSAELGAVSPEFAVELGELQRKLRELFGVEDAEQLVLVMRVAHDAGSTPRSERLPRDMIMATPTPVDSQERLD